MRKEKKGFSRNGEPFCGGRERSEGLAMEKQVYSLGIRIP